MPSAKRFRDNLPLSLSLFEDRERLSVKGKEEKVESPPPGRSSRKLLSRKYLSSSFSSLPRSTLKILFNSPPFFTSFLHAHLPPVSPGTIILFPRTETFFFFFFFTAMNYLSDRCIRNTYSAPRTFITFPSLFSLLPFFLSLLRRQTFQKKRSFPNNNNNNDSNGDDKKKSVELRSFLRSVSAVRSASANR